MKGSILICVALLFGEATMAPAGSRACKHQSAKKLGTSMGETLLRECQLFAQARGREWVDCSDSPEGEEMERLCAPSRQLETIADSIDAAIDAGCIKDDAPYENTPEHYTFGVLLEALSPSDPTVRWHILARIHSMCDDPSILTTTGAVACKVDVEKACIKILAICEDPQNRRRALEILSGGYATASSVPILRRILVNSPDGAERSLAIQAMQRAAPGGS